MTFSILFYNKLMCGFLYSLFSNSVMELTASKIYDTLKQIVLEEERVRSDDCLSVTEICGCLRRAFFDRKSKKKYTESSLVHLTMGKAFHSAFEEVLQRLGCETEVKIMLPINEFIISGRVDGISEEFIVELKTCNKDVEEPYSSHLMQINAYMYMAKVHTGYLIYVNKSNGKIHVFKVSFNPEVWRQFIERAKLLYQSLKTNTAPPPFRIYYYL